jgi:DNA-binding transcriptional ArsR family regulator
MRALSGEVVSRVAARARAFGDPTRVRILAALGARDLAVGSIARSIAAPQSTVSKHLQILFNAGLVARRRAASTVIYSLASDDTAECLRLLGLSPRTGRTPRMRA